MKTSTFLAGLLLLAAPALALEPSTPLISSGPVVVTAKDFEAQMLRIPDNLRQEARASLERVATMADALFVNRVLAQEARKMGLLDDPLIAARTRQVVEAYEARVYLDNFEKTLPEPTIEARSREIYLTDRAKYKIPERYEVDHVLVNLWGRTSEMAVARLKEARAKLQAGADLAAIVKEYGSDTATRGQPSGKLGVVAASQVDVAIGEVLPKLKIGEWSEPILTRAGYHIVRVTAKLPPRDIPFEDVKEAILEEERARAAKKATDEKFQAIRNAPGTRIDSEALKALVQPITKEEIDAAHKRAMSAGAPKGEGATEARPR